MEKWLENLLYASRWLLAPIYLGLSLVLAMLTVKFFERVFYLLFHLFDLAETSIILKMLSLVDIVLVGGLLVMVMYSGYENFISKLDIDENSEKLNWLREMDSDSLKAKVAASIVAISSIHLLKIFMDAEHVANDKLMWYVTIHLTFVASAIGMGALDFVMKNRKSGSGSL